ncbi:hypothetical protein AAG906_033705 [Vitis piasezkii]
MITTTTTIVAIPPTHSAANPWWRGPSSTIIRFPPTKLRPLSSSPSTSVSVVEEGEEEAPPLPSDAAAPLQSQDPPLGGCKACGREEMEKGCNGEGRIQGGIGTVPGFGWWPIKAYRPCPGFVASGGRYRRRGQSMDEVAFGRGGKGASMASDEDVQSRQKKKRPKEI